MFGSGAVIAFGKRLFLFLAARALVRDIVTDPFLKLLGRYLLIPVMAVYAGGLLEPLQANPTIIEDDCFIGARSEVVEGVIVERGSVLSMGVYVGQSTKIYNRESGEILRGRIPEGSVVVPGSLPAVDGSHSLYCAVIVKQVDEQTRARTSVNEILRHAE